ncbi:MAG: hypothetical protein AAGI71_02360 [Bacteroidota bacterium]
MKPTRLVREFEEVARQLGLRVRLERGSFRGGYCLVDGEPFVVLNRRHPPEVHVQVLAESLRTQDLDRVYLKPAVRSALEALWHEAP